MSFTTSIKSVVDHLVESESEQSTYGESQYIEEEVEPVSTVRYPSTKSQEHYYLTEEEEKELCRAFTILDVKGEGVLDVRILENFLMILGRLPFDDELRILLSYAKEKSGEDSVGMNFQNFKKYVSDHLKNTSDEEELLRAFRIFDSTPPTGNANLKELRFYLKHKGMKLTDDEIDFLFKVENFWMLEDSPEFPYQELADKMLSKPECQNQFLNY